MYNNNVAGCGTDMVIVLKATSKTGKVATVNIQKEVDLALSFDNVEYMTDSRIPDVMQNPFRVLANQSVTWSAACSTTASSECRYLGFKIQAPSLYVGEFKVIDGNTEDRSSPVRITATTPANQRITLTLVRKIN